jgi:DNA repair photolyase
MFGILSGPPTTSVTWARRPRPRQSQRVKQIALFDDTTVPPPGPPPPIGAQGDITYIPTNTRTALNNPTATGMGYWSINPYIGCAFGCAYCYARYAHRYRADREGASTDLPAWLAFERRIFVKRNVAEVVRKTLRQGGPRHRALVEGEWLVIGTATDPYQPAERRYRLTRSILQVLAEHPGIKLVIITKSPLIARDVDLLQRLAKRGALTVHLSLITVDRALARRIEPRAPTPEARLRAIERLASAGIDIGVNIMPILPGITDDPAALDALIAQVAKTGASHINAGSLRLRSDAFHRYLPFIESEFPHLAARYRATYATSHEMGDRYRAGLRQVVGRIAAAHGIRFGRSGGVPDEDEEPPTAREQLELLSRETVSSG